jgi:hypothetical protein
MARTLSWENGFYRRVYHADKPNYFIAEAKRTPFKYGPQSTLAEPGDLWFMIGATEQEAVANLQKALQEVA